MRTYSPDIGEFTSAVAIGLVWSCRFASAIFAFISRKERVLWLSDPSVAGAGTVVTAGLSVAKLGPSAVLAEPPTTIGVGVGLTRGLVETDAGTLSVTTTLTGVGVGSTMRTGPNAEAVPAKRETIQKTTLVIDGKIGELFGLKGSNLTGCERPAILRFAYSTVCCQTKSKKLWNIQANVMAS